MVDNTPYINLREITDWAKYHINELYGLVAAPGSTSWGSISGTLSTQSDLQGALNNKQPLAAVLTGTTASFTTAQESKLAGIATGATVYTDEMVDDRVAALLVAGTNMTITYNDVANTLTLAASGGGGSGNAETAEVNFGSASSTETGEATATVAAPWVASSSIIVCSPAGTATADHDPDDYFLEGITAYATNIVNGVSFDIVAVAPNNTWGRYNINAVGV